MISIIYSYRNLDCTRLKLSLESLEKQNNINFEVILVDYGSSKFFKEAVQKLTSQFSFVRYIYTNTEYQIWSRSRALNIGIKESKFNIIFSSDVDMIFNENLINNLLELYNEQKVTHFKVGYLKKGVKLPIKTHDIESYSKIGAQGMLLFSKDKAFEITGYDEFMSGWGCEDNDFVNRFKLIGVTSEYHENILIYHQWHKKFAEYSDRTLTQKLGITNVIGFNHFKMQQNLINKVAQVNEIWGEKITEEQYKKLQQYQTTKFLNNKRATIDFLLNDLNVLKQTHIIITEIDNKDKFKFLKKIIRKEAEDRTYYSMKFINDVILKKLIFLRAKNYYFQVDSSLKKIELKVIF